MAWAGPNLPFVAIFKLVNFFSVVWIASVVAPLLGISAPLAELAAGVLLAPTRSYGGLMPKEYADFFTFTGHIGVALATFEAGLCFEHLRAPSTGRRRGAGLLVLGRFALGLLVVPPILAALHGAAFWPAAFTAGLALAPAGASATTAALHDTQMLSETVGQVLGAATLVNNGLSLSLWTVISGPAEAEDWIPLLVRNICCTAALLVVSWGLAVVCLPRLLGHIVKWTTNGTVPLSTEELLVAIMLGLLLLYSVPTHLMGSHLLACFLAGASFAVDPALHHQALAAWLSQTKFASTWLLRCFFSCSVAASVPWEEFTSPSTMASGVLLGLGLWLLTQAMCMAFLSKDSSPLAVALSCPSELTFMIAHTAAADGFLKPPALVAQLMWVLVVQSLVAPIVLRQLLRQQRVHADTWGGLKAT